MLKLYSIKRSDLSENQIRSICYLKESFWKYGIKSQLAWFKKNVRPNDINNLVYRDNEIIGYTLLRNFKVQIKEQNKNKTISYIWFDTLILKKKFRGQNLSKKLMLLNSRVIKKKKCVSFLFCKKKLVNFYKNYRWYIFDKKKMRNKYKKNHNLLIFNRIILKKYGFSYKRLEINFL